MKGKDDLYSKYIEHAKNPEGDERRYKELYARGMHYFIPQYIAFNPKHRTTTTDTKVERNTSTGVHVYNLINRAHSTQYLPNDNWVIPQISEAATNPKIREHLILHPVTLVEDFRRGLADNIGEKKMLSDNYGIFGLSLIHI